MRFRFTDHDTYAEALRIADARCVHYGTGHYVTAPAPYVFRGSEPTSRFRVVAIDSYNAATDGAWIARSTDTVATSLSAEEL